MMIEQLALLFLLAQEPDPHGVEPATDAQFATDAERSLELIVVANASSVITPTSEVEWRSLAAIEVPSGETYVSGIRQGTISPLRTTHDQLWVACLRPGLGNMMESGTLIAQRFLEAVEPQESRELVARTAGRLTVLSGLRGSLLGGVEESVNVDAGGEWEYELTLGGEVSYVVGGDMSEVQAMRIVPVRPTGLSADPESTRKRLLFGWRFRFPGTPDPRTTSRSPGGMKDSEEAVRVGNAGKWWEMATQKYLSWINPKATTSIEECFEQGGVYFFEARQASLGLNPGGVLRGMAPTRHHTILFTDLFESLKILAELDALSDFKKIDASLYAFGAIGSVPMDSDLEAVKVSSELREGRRLVRILNLVGDRELAGCKRVEVSIASTGLEFIEIHYSND